MRAEIAALTDEERELLRANSPGESLGYWERRPVSEVEAAVLAIQRRLRPRRGAGLTWEQLWADEAQR